jgi:hypothetical protein
VHDPDVLAFEIVRPWPQRSSLHTPGLGDARWRFLMHHDHHEPYCTVNNCTGNPFPWWKPKSWSRFWVLAGREFYWPPLVTVWHREPGGADSGSVCKHTRRVWDDDALKWRYKRVNGWRWHVHHWHLTVPPVLAARRWLLTRCAWCGGPSRKGSKVNHSRGWDGPRGRWWQGEPDLYHEGCYTVWAAHLLCLCAAPVLNHNGYGQCAACGKSRAWRQVPDEADRLLAALPRGSRIPAGLMPALEIIWAQRRAERDDAEAGP